MRALTHDDRGAVAVFVALVLTVLLGVGAIVIDIGALYQERREVQNGADAAALEAAGLCAEGNTCPADVEDAAEAIAGANAGDTTSEVLEVCASAGVTGVPPCSGPGVELYGYTPPAAPAGAKWVRVTVGTRTSGGGNEISYRLAQFLDVVEDGKQVRASSTAAWGPVGGATTIPLTFSVCEYDEATASNPIQTGPPFTGAPTYIYFHGSEPAGSCPAGPSGGDLPGGFGWLDSNGCQAAIEAGGWVDDETGVAVPNGCDPTTWQDKTVLLPIYDQTNGLTGSNGEYHIAGFAGFHITGYKLSGNGWPSGFNCPEQPGGSGRCIRGYFTTITTSGEIGSGADFGAVVVDLIG